jgi:L-ascorbate metabolism protein UlaG (beta-lactamase superfamily)
MRVFKFALLGLLSVALVLTALVVYFWNQRPQSPPFAPSPMAQNPSVHALFLGTSSMAWTDGEHTWMLDGFFSRQPVGQVLFGSLQVEREQVLAVAHAVFSRLQVPARLDGVWVAHSHYDHALDAPFLVQQFGGLLYGSRSTRQIALGQGLPEASTQTLEDSPTHSVGAFEIQAVVSAHAPTGFTGGFNQTPLSLPAHALAFKEGVSYTFVVSHAGKPKALIQPSAGFVPNQNRDIEVDTVFLGAGGLGKQTDAYLQAYWKEMVTQTKAKRVYLIHWDDFTKPLLAQGEPVPSVAMPVLLDDFSSTLRRLELLATREGVELIVLNAWQRVTFQ